VTVLRFGTDGVRGNADADLTSAFVISLGRAVARALRPSRALIGRDTRESGARIETELARGLVAEGVTPVFLGVLPTPAIAFHAARAGTPAAIVSASHNPWADNGVKVIGPDGRKLPDDAESRIEAELHALAASTVPDAVEHAAALPDAGAPYIGHLLAALDGHTLQGMRVVLDCANGAAFEVGPSALRAAGADVTVLHADPDGRNINASCGSTHPVSLQHAVREQGAALGLALDGDADRVIAVDERGEIVDGDQIMTITALDLHERGHLRGDAVVTTVMSNIGLRRALREAGIDVIETPVGDRHVVAEMQARDLAVGGEQSGHIVYADHATTGDGLLTGLFLCDAVRRSGKPLSALAAQMVRYPQLLVNVRVARTVDLDAAPALWDCVRTIEAELGDQGRVLVRASGTEPLVRIMAEAPSQDAAERAVERLRRVVETEFGTRSAS
jgi:phosphoglucosamine mutase